MTRRDARATHANQDDSRVLFIVLGVRSSGVVRLLDNIGMWDDAIIGFRHAEKRSMMSTMPIRI